MSLEIRYATQDDAPYVAEIIQTAFDETPSVSQIRTCIHTFPSWVYVAVIAERVAGFVFGFPTQSITGQQRAELDLLAVHPQYQAQGAGSKLIQTFTDEQSDYEVVRALVAVDNHSMEKTLPRFGYIPSDTISALYVSSKTTEQRSCPENSHLIPVTTMTYNGIWLEGDITQDTIHYANHARKSSNDVVGAVVPTSDTQTIATLENADFAFIKHYRRWHKCSD